VCEVTDTVSSSRSEFILVLRHLKWMPGLLNCAPCASSALSHGGSRGIIPEATF
jgi:hypothetical protein